MRIDTANLRQKNEDRPASAGATTQIRLLPLRVASAISATIRKILCVLLSLYQHKITLNVVEGALTSHPPYCTVLYNALVQIKWLQNSSTESQNIEGSAVSIHTTYSQARANFASLWDQVIQNHEMTDHCLLIYALMY
jgi:hypothetical protein